MKKLHALLGDLLNISKQKIILEPDVIIAGKLLSFEKLLPADQSKINDEMFEKIESVLIQCLYSNNSQISFQCSIRIAECLLQLYQGNRQMKIWNLITAFNKNPVDSVSYTTGFILNKVGKYAKSVVNGVAKTLFNKVYPAVAASRENKKAFSFFFVLCSCFKASPRDMNSYVDKSLNTVKKHILIPYEPVQLLCIKLLTKLVKNGQAVAEKIIPIMTQLLQDQNMPYIIDQSCYLIAKLAYSQLQNQTEEKSESSSGEINSKGKKISPVIYMAFNMMENFKKYFSDIFPRFLSLLEPDFINSNREDIFRLVRRIDPEQLKGLIYLLGIDVKRELFAKIVEKKKSIELIPILLILAYDTSSLIEAGNCAYELALEANLKERSKISAFFSELVKKDPETTSKFLKRGSKFLANPPKDSNDHLDKDMRGIALLIASVLTVAPNRKQLIELIEENIVNFLRESWKSESITSPSFQPSFTILTALPKRYVMIDEVDRLLSLFPRYLLANPELNETDKITALSMAETLTLFLSVHTNFESTIPILECCLQTDFLKSHFVLLCCYMIIPKLTTRADDNEYSMLAQNLRPIILKPKPTQAFVTNLVKFPFITRTLLLKNEKFEMPEKLNRFFVTAPSSEIMVRVFKTFPDFTIALPDQIKKRWIKWLVVTNATTPFAHCLIITLINDKRTQIYIPQNLHEVILSVIHELDRTDYLQTASEVIACWAKLFPKIVPKKVLSILSDPEQFDDRDHHKLKAKFFVLAALFAHVQLSDDVISNQMLILNNLIKTVDDNNLTSFGLHALSSLFQAYPAQLAAMPFTDSQANFLLSLINTNKSLDSFVLFHISRAFSSLLPIISPDIEKSRPLAVPIIKIIIQLIQSTQLPFCKQTFFNMMHSVFSFIRQYGSIVPMTFPASKGVNLSCKIEACQAFADMLLVEKTKLDELKNEALSRDDSMNESEYYETESDINQKNITNFNFMSLIPQCLMLLQRTDHPNTNIFIIAVASNFALTALSQLVPREENADPTQEAGSAATPGTSPNSALISNEVNSDSIDNPNNKNELVIPRNYYEQIQEWTRLIKMCVSAGNLPATGIVKIGASDNVKLCMLKVAREILPLLLKTYPLLNEALDDLMTSLTRAVESRQPDIQQVAYPLIKQVVTDFGKIKNSENGMPIIGLYDIMFASAVKIGFYNLDVSGDFVLSFLNFHINGIRGSLKGILADDKNVESDNKKSAIMVMNSSYDEFVSILDYFVSGFKECDHKTWHYHAIASKLTLIAIQKPEFRKKLQDFFPRFEKDFSSIIFKAGKLWNEDPPNDAEIGKFRLNYSSFFSELLESFIWINAFLAEKGKKKKKNVNLEEEEEEEENEKVKSIKPNQFLTFLLSEITNGRYINNDELENEDNDDEDEDDTTPIEEWRVISAFSALGAMIEYSTDFFSQISKVSIPTAKKTFGRARGKNKHKRYVEIYGKYLSNAIKAASICYEKYDDVVRPCLMRFMRPASEILEIYSSSIADLESQIEGDESSKQKSKSKQKQEKDEENENDDENEYLAELKEKLRIVYQLRKEAWKRLVSILVDDNFDPIVLCYLIKNGGSELISQYALNFADLIYENFTGKTYHGRTPCTIETEIALCTMLFYVADDKLDELLDFALKIKSRRDEKKIIFRNSFVRQIFKFLPINDSNYNRGTNNEDTNADGENEENKNKGKGKVSPKVKKIARKYGEKISRLVWNHFREGGQDFLIQLLCDHPCVAEVVMLSEDASAYNMSILEDYDSILSYIEFIKFVFCSTRNQASNNEDADKQNEKVDFNFSFIQNNDEYIQMLIRFALRVIIQWEDPIIDEVENDNGKSKKKSKKDSKFSDETKMKARNLVFSACQILRLISLNSAPLIRIAFKEMGVSYQSNAFKAVFLVAKRAVLAQEEIKRKRGAAANFQLSFKTKSAGRSRRRKDGDDDNPWQTDDDGSDWQDLAIEE
ncbi:hypothetical protein M9Y10_038114 [Tritrichomonas musculus]|uniref:Non-specific serine/threonine protein kinase n=1 Tax=Tritrichomonas musculus TaxID=1915356 RepID=A0ABR2K7H6_9EUKA